MTLTYRFKKEKLKNGSYVSRPRILVELSGINGTILIPALIDTGCDITVIPKGIAESIGLNIKGNKDKLFAYRESTDVIESRIMISFLGKEHRQTVVLNNIPILITIDNEEDENEITLGIAGIFDAFNITFKKEQNKIILKESIGMKKYFRKIIG